MGPGSMGNPPRVVRTEGGGRALPRGQGEGGREGGLAGSRCTVKALGICPSATLRLRARTHQKTRGADMGCFMFPVKGQHVCVLREFSRSARGSPLTWSAVGARL